MMDDILTTYSTSAQTGPTLSAKEILDGIDFTMQEFNRLSRSVPVSFNKVIVNDMFTQQEKPIRVHKKRRNQSESYHRRISKKWLKRYGTKPEEFAYLINDGYCGGTLVVSEKIRQELKRQNYIDLYSYNLNRWFL